MKKIFTLAIALLGFTGVAKAASVDDLEVLKHSYVLVCDDLGARPGKGVLFGANHFLDVTGGSTATNKGKVDLSKVDPATDADGNPLPQYVTQDIVDKYGADYGGGHYNFLRLKNTQDVIAMKLTAGSKLIIFEHGNSKVGKEARIPRISKKADLSDALNEAPGDDYPATIPGYRWEFTVPDDGLYYLGSYNGDMFISFIIVEANEAPGTPTVKVGEQTYEGGLYFREVTCKANDAEGFPTVVTYTTDGTAPTASSTKYTGPIKCYSDMTVKFQAFMDLGTGEADDAAILDGADNEANVSFVFNAPTISTDGANVTVTSEYPGATNFVTLDGNLESAEEISNFTLEESATVTAFSKIENGAYATFTTKSTAKDVYVLNPIKEQKTIVVTNAEVVVDEEATATSTTGTVYKVENGEISADKKDFFVKNLEFAVVKDPAYQIFASDAYIKMNNTNISFKLAEGDSVNVVVICTKNSCKTLNPDNDENVTTDRKCYVNVSGTTYGNDDVTAEDGNIIKFGLKGGEGGSVFTFQKYSGTGNIMIASIEITPVSGEEAPQTEDLIDKFTYCWNGSETVTHNDDHTVTFEAQQWGGLAAWLVADDVAEDWSEYSQIVFEFAEPTPCATQILMQYNDGSADTSAWIEAGATKAVADLGAGKASMKQVALQSSEATTLHITKIYLVKSTAGINAVQVSNIENGALYNVAGQRVDENYKGLVIKNGKKYILK